MTLLPEVEAAVLDAVRRDHQATGGKRCGDRTQGQRSARTHRRRRRGIECGHAEPGECSNGANGNTLGERPVPPKRRPRRVKESYV